MPSFVPGNRSRTASARTWAALWRIGPSSPAAPWSISSVALPRSGASRTSSSPAMSCCSSLMSAPENHKTPRPCRTRGRSSRGPTRVRDAVPAPRSLAAITGGPGPVHRPLTGGAAPYRSPGFQTWLGSLWVRWTGRRVPIDALRGLYRRAALSRRARQTDETAYAVTAVPVITRDPDG